MMTAAANPATLPAAECARILESITDYAAAQYRAYPDNAHGTAYHMRAAAADFWRNCASAESAYHAGIIGAEQANTAMQAASRAYTAECAYLKADDARRAARDAYQEARRADAGIPYDAARAAAYQAAFDAAVVRARF